MLARLERGLVTVMGPDARSFLQSLISQDVDPLLDGEGAHSLLLHPQGKLLADFRLLRVDEQTWWCDCERSAAPALAAGLDRFRIRVKAEVADASAGFELLAARGEERSGAALEGLGVAVPAEAHAHVPWRDARVVRAAWPDGSGVDVIGPAATIDAAVEAIGVTPAGEEVYERARIEAGVPRQGYDTDDRTIPQEAFLERTAVSFTKGCFVGQELVCRIDTRGHVNRLLRRLRLDGVVPRGARVEHDGKVVGEVTSVAGDVALAPVRREVEPPADVTVVWEHGAVAARAEAI